MVTVTFASLATILWILISPSHGFECYECTVEKTNESDESNECSDGLSSVKKAHCEASGSVCVKVLGTFSYKENDTTSSHTIVHRGCAPNTYEPHLSPKPCGKLADPEDEKLFSTFTDEMGISATDLRVESHLACICDKDLCNDKKIERSEGKGISKTSSPGVTIHGANFFTVSPIVLCEFILVTAICSNESNKRSISVTNNL